MVYIASVASGSDGEEANTSLWVSTNDYCAALGLTESYTSGFFIPVLSRSQEVMNSSNANSSELTIAIVGTLLIPCDLNFTLDCDGNTFTQAITSVNETLATAELDKSRATDYDDATVVKISLTYSYQGNSYSTQSLTIKQKDEDALESQNKERTVELIILIVAIVLIILLTILIAGCTYWRYRHYWKLNNPSAASQQEELRFLS